MYRPLKALGLAGLIVLACVSLSKAQDASGQCIAKDQVIDDVAAKVGPDGLQFRKVTGAAAAVIATDMTANGVENVGSSYVLFWKDGAENTVILVAIFDEHNCFNRFIKGPRDAVLKMLDGVGA